MYRLDVRAGAALCDEEIEQLYALRLRFMRLKPTCDPESDRACFFRTVRKCTSVGRVLNAAGEPDAMGCAMVLDRVFEGRPVRVTVIEYGFTAPELRKNWRTAMMNLLLWARSISWRPDMPQFVGGIGYPSGFMRTVELFGETHIACGAELDASPDWSFALEQLIEEMARDTWDPVRGSVSLNTIPPELGSSWIARNATHPAYLRYVAQIPNWSEGYAAPLLARTSPWSIVDMLRDGARGLLSVRAASPRPVVSEEARVDRAA